MNKSRLLANKDQVEHTEGRWIISTALIHQYISLMGTDQWSKTLQTQQAGQ